MSSSPVQGSLKQVRALCILTGLALAGAAASAGRASQATWTEVLLDCSVGIAAITRPAALLTIAVVGLIASTRHARNASVADVARLTGARSVGAPMPPRRAVVQGWSAVRAPVDAGVLATASEEAMSPAGRCTTWASVGVTRDSVYSTVLALNLPCP